MPVSPGHHYIGPGNVLEGEVPLDEDDRIAFEHDWRYEFARSFKDISDSVYLMNYFILRD